MQWVEFYVIYYAALEKTTATNSQQGDLNMDKTVTWREITKLVYIGMDVCKKEDTTSKQANKNVLFN